MVLGVDIGGSHITAGLVDIGSGSLSDSSFEREKVNSWGDVDSIITSWSQVIKKASGNLSHQNIRIGIAMPGPFDYEQGIAYLKDNKKYQSLYGLNVKELLAQKLGIDTDNIRLINDAASFLQGEILVDGNSCHHALGLTLGTGLGSAVYHNGVAKDADLWQSPFMNGIAEDFISTRWFIKRYFELTGINVLDVKALNEIDNASAKTVFKEFSANLCAFITAFVNKEKAEVVYIGGNITKTSPRFLPVLRNCLIKNGINIPVQISKAGEFANLLGAANCWANTAEHAL